MRTASSPGWFGDLSPWRPLQLAAASSPARRLPTDWAPMLGEYVGAWAAGATLGYVVTGNDGAAFRTGLATSSLRNLVDVVTHRNDYPIWWLAFLGITGAGSLAYVWRKGRKP
jgi:hypothetical protein